MNGTEQFLQDCMCAQRRLRSACASAQADQSHLCPLEDALHPWLSTMLCEDSDQTARMRMLIWVFVGRTCSLAVDCFTVRQIYCRKLVLRGHVEQSSLAWNVVSRLVSLQNTLSGPMTTKCWVHPATNKQKTSLYSFYRASDIQEDKYRMNES